MKTHLKGEIYLSEKSLEDKKGLSALILKGKLSRFEDEVTLLSLWSTNSYFYKNSKSLIKINDIFKEAIESLIKERKAIEKEVDVKEEELLFFHRYEFLLDKEIEKNNKFMEKIHNLSLISNISKVDKGYAVLEYMYNNKENSLFTLKEIHEGIDEGKSLITETIKELKKLEMISEIFINNENLYSTTLKTISMFIFYTESKKFTNKIEKIRRDNRKRPNK